MLRFAECARPHFGTNVSNYCTCMHRIFSARAWLALNSGSRSNGQAPVHMRLVASAPRLLRLVASAPLERATRCFAMAALPKAFCAEFKELLVEPAVLAPNEILQKCMLCLAKHNQSYVLQSVLCKYFLVHEENRGKLMLSPHNVHRNAVRIHLVGGGMTQLTNAVCIELAPSGARREKQLVANKKLVDRAGGLLAEVSGEERYITVGCGHTAAFLQDCSYGRRADARACHSKRGWQH